MTKKLYRSSTDQKICGVCGGLAEYINIDATIIRVIWAIASIPTLGTGILVYIICALVIPEKPDGTVTVVDEDNSKNCRVDDGENN